MDWAVYGALIGGFLAVAAAVVFLAVRVLQGWRTFKRFRRHTAKELDRLARVGDETARKAETAADTEELTHSLARLRVTLARFNVLRAAFDEATGVVTRVTAVYPRK